MKKKFILALIVGIASISVANAHPISHHQPCMMPCDYRYNHSNMMAYNPPPMIYNHRNYRNQYNPYRNNFISFNNHRHHSGLSIQLHF